MPKLLQSTSVVGSEYNQVLSRFSELIKFIHKNSDRYIGTNQQHYQKVVPNSSSAAATSLSLSSSLAGGPSLLSSSTSVEKKIESHAEETIA